MDMVDAALQRGHLLVSAPAGSGKTSLVAAWAARENRGREVAWLTLGEGEGDPERFLDHVAAALSSTTVGARALASRAEAQVSDGDESLLAAIAEAAADLGSDVVLVLDDFHLVVGSGTERLLRQILRYSPGPLRFVVLSREEPALGQTALRLRNRIRELGQNDLALTVEETTELFAVSGLDLPATTVRQLHAETLGWAVALRAIAGSLSDGADVPEALESARRFAQDYLDAEVLSRQSAEMRDFLRRATTVDPICGLLADALTGREGGARTLADLHRERIFIEPDGPMFDERCTWFRWHPMLIGALRSELRDAEPGLARELHRVAARWMSRHGMPGEAVVHALAAGDADTAAEILKDSWVDLLLSGEVDEIRHLLPLFEEERLNLDAEFAVIGAFVAAQESDLSRSCLLARGADEHRDTVPPDRRLAVGLMSVNVRLCVAGLTGHQDAEDVYPSALSLLGRAWRQQLVLTKEQRKRRVLLLYHLGIFELAQWRYDDAAGHLREALADSAALGMEEFVVHSRVQLALHDFVTGRLDMALTGARDGLHGARSHRLHGDQSLAVAHVVEAAVHHQRGSEEAALASLRQARAAVHSADRVNRLRVGFMTQDVLLRRGESAAAERQLDELRGLVNNRRSPGWAQLLLAVAEARNLLATGHVEDALNRMASAAATASERFENRVWRRHYAELLLHADRPGDARDLLEPWIGAADKGGPLEIEALLVDSLAAEALDLPEDSARSLTTAVRLAAPEGIAQPFLSHAARLQRPLESLLRQGTGDDEYLSELLARLPDADRREERIPVQLVPLTARELEVLRALRGGAGNDVVAAEMFISPHTLRSHIKQINRKLGTTSRRESVARARRMGLL